MGMCSHGASAAAGPAGSRQLQGLSTGHSWQFSIGHSWQYILAYITMGTQMVPMHLQKKKKNHYIFSSLLRADQMPGPPREGQLMWTFFLNTHQ